MRRMLGIRGWGVVWALLALPCCAFLCLAQDAGAPAAEANAKTSPIDKYKPTGYVNDFAEMIDPKVQLQIDAVCTDLVKQRQTEMTIVTVDSLEGMTIKDFSVQLFNKWGVGPKETNRGVMVLLSRGDRQWRITVSRGLESVLTDEEAAKLGAEMLPMLRKGDYGEALLHAAKRIRDEVMEKVK
jgi:uncharacterized protein